MKSVSSDQMPSYIYETMWHDRFGADIKAAFCNICAHISLIYRFETIQKQQRLFSEPHTKQTATAFLQSKCNCTGKCVTGRCLSEKNGITCSTLCHGSRKCENKDAEVALSNCKQCLPQCDTDPVQGSSKWLTDVHMTAAPSH